MRLVARLLVIGFCWATSMYALVASSTFAYLQFLRPRVFPWTGVFADWHAPMAWLWLALLGGAIGRDVVRPWRGRSAARLFLLLAAGAVAVIARKPLLPSLSNDSRSLTVAALALLPIVGLALLDTLSHAARLTTTGPRARPPRDTSPDVDRDAALLEASVLTAVTLSVIYAVLALVRVSSEFEPDLVGSGLIAAFGHSVVAHVSVFVPVFLATALLDRLAGAHGARAHAVWSAGLTLAAAIVFDRLIGNALSVAGAWRPIIAGLAGLACVGTWADVQLTRAAADRPAGDDVRSLYLGTPRPRGRARRLAALVVIACAAWSLRRATAIADWDDVVLRLGTIAVWVATFGWAYRAAGSRAPRRLSNVRLVVVCVAPLAALTLAFPSAGVLVSLARYPVHDPSYRLARSLLSPEAGTPGFTRYLRAHTGLTDIDVAPRPIDQVRPLEPVPEAQRPPIFLFVVDSLRADYLAPYNSRASFTPAIGAFARDSVVFRNAFTRYGGTGLSVPAIWAGSALPHKQYVKPFAPMNALEKLLDANRYRRFVGLDSIMVQLLEPSPRIDELDRGVTVMDYELCRTLTELEGKLAASPTTAVFAYTLPQDVHMSRLSHWTTPAGDFTGFFAPYAGRIQAMDACFGRFIETLKRLGLYERSLIILTSDHGEMLGENGQFGHSYHMFPPVVRVPLIVHLPAAVAATQPADPGAIALSTDITPTIYSVLGYRLAPQGRLLGRPLIGQDDEARRARRRDRYVLAASYGAVYAVVSRNGRRLYVADGVRGEDHLYERQARAEWREREPTADERAVEQYAIRQHVDEVAQVFALPDREPR